MSCLFFNFTYLPGMKEKSSQCFHTLAALAVAQHEIIGELYTGIQFVLLVVQKEYRLNMGTKLEHILTRLQNLYGTNTAHATLFPQKYRFHQFCIF